MSNDSCQSSAGASKWTDSGSVKTPHAKSTDNIIILRALHKMMRPTESDWLIDHVLFETGARRARSGRCHLDRCCCRFMLTGYAFPVWFVPSGKERFTGCDSWSSPLPTRCGKSNHINHQSTSAEEISKWNGMELRAKVPTYTVTTVIHCINLKTQQTTQTIVNLCHTQIFWTLIPTL